MRLTGGDGKGRKLADPPSGVRPTSGRAKELLFQLLFDRIDDANVLDIFAGTGALGIEAIARGAGKAVFLEKERKVVRIIQENIRRCKFEDKTKIIQGDALKRLKQGASAYGPFDIIFADPPYADAFFTEILTLVRDEKLLAEDGIFMFEIATRYEFEIPKGWTLSDDRKLGDTRLLFITVSAL